MTRASSPAYGWVIVGAGALMTCVAIGAMFSLAVFLQPMSADTGWSRTGISTAMTLDFLAMGFAAFGWGALSDRFGARIVVLSGARAARPRPGAGEPRHQPDRVPAHVRHPRRRGRRRLLRADDRRGHRAGSTSNRSLAVSLVSAGMGVAPMTISPFARWLITNYDWRAAHAGHRHRRLGAADRAGGAAGAPRRRRCSTSPRMPGVATPGAGATPA